jgi:hypothetical protein
MYISLIVARQLSVKCSSPCSPSQLPGKHAAAAAHIYNNIDVVGRIILYVIRVIKGESVDLCIR